MNMLSDAKNVRMLRSSAPKPANEKTRCSGCGHIPGYWGMKPSEYIKIGGRWFCNDACELESGVQEMESAYLDSLADEAF